jgi:Putative DNA-binding domain
MSPVTASGRRQTNSGRASKLVVVPDKRTDLQKLLELLGEPEENHLDYKERVDLDVNEDKLKFVKDVVTMSNRPPGGYVLIGVGDNGKPCMQQGTISDRRRFDGARLGDVVRSYIEAQINIRADIHDHNGYEIVVIFVEHMGLPVPFCKLGQYQDANGRMQTVFHPGQIWVREGAANVPIRYAHWQDVLSEYAKRIRDEASTVAQTVLQELQSSPGGVAAIQLLMEMDDITFANATAALIEARNDVRLRQFLRSLKRFVNVNRSLADCQAALDKWAIFSAQALNFERADLAKDAIDALYEAYTELGTGTDLARKRLAVVIRIYAIGSLAVRLSAWETVHSLAIRPVATAPFGDWIYASWIPHAQVEASRAGLTRDDRGGLGGYLISAARELIVHHPALRPDIGDDEIRPAEELAPDDELLNSLCRFDIVYCFIVAAEGVGRGGYYPSSAAFNEDRAQWIALKIVDDQAVRRRLFPNSDDARVADALANVYETTIRESQTNYGGRWWSAPPRVRAFIEEHSPRR